jgi:hypothetical protein
VCHKAVWRASGNLVLAQTVERPWVAVYAFVRFQANRGWRSNDHSREVPPEVADVLSAGYEDVQNSRPTFEIQSDHFGLALRLQQTIPALL